MTEELETLDSSTEETSEEQNTSEDIAELRRRADVSSQNFERAKKAEEARKALEEENEILRAQLETESFTGDDVVQRQLKEIASKLERLEEEKQLEGLYSQYPALKDKQSEFNSFRLDYPGVGLQAVAKLFLAENDLIGESPKRKGLEKAGGGQRVPPSTGKQNADDVKRLRETNYKEYVKQLKAGKIQINTN